ncbi:hypothetical protein CMU19_04310 [Elizabethkingia anophelis]|nr:hypothetical protein [Elizabethkingia anophelis]
MKMKKRTISLEEIKAKGYNVQPTGKSREWMIYNGKFQKNFEAKDFKSALEICATVINDNEIQKSD